MDKREIQRDNTLCLPFDLYVRNKIVSDVINARIVKSSRPLKILDVGGRNGCLREFLQQNCKLWILDIKEPEQNEENHYVVGDIIRAPFDDNTFDVVTSQDVFEHISPENRLKALEEMRRISKNFIILAAPFYSEDVERAERLANEFFFQLTNKDHPWLIEHIKNGLPKQEVIEKFVKEHGLNVRCVNSNNLGLWLLLQQFILYAYAYSLPTDKVESVYQYYNANFENLGDSLSPTYRKIYFISKSITFKHLPEFLDQHFEMSKYLDLINMISQIKNTQVQNLNGTIREMEGTIREMEGTFGWQILNKFRVWRDKILKPNTTRRYVYDLAIKAIKYIQREGIKGFLRKVYERYSLRIPLSRFRREVEVVNINMLGFQTHTPLSLKGGGIQGSFYCHLSNLSKVQILTTTYKRINSDLQLCIKTDSVNGNMIRRLRIKGKQIIDNGYTCFRFKPIKDSKGKTFFFELKSIGNLSAAVWYNSEFDFPELKLYKDGKTISGSINFKALARSKVRDTYELWILKNEATKTELQKQKYLSKEFTYRPKISIITPVYNIDKGILIKTIESVINQTYDSWELCLVDGNSSKSRVKEILNSYASKDSRIRVNFLAENKGIAGNSNEALALATGEFVGFLDHDDELAPFALYEVVKLLNKNQDIDFIYSDEDKISTNDKRYYPHFKPDWSPDTLRSYNYITHFAVIRKKIIDEVGGFREGYEGSQDYDLFLRIVERTNRIAHIPKVFYHWRTIGSSAAANPKAKMYAYDSAKRALKEHIQRMGLNGEVYDGLFPSSYRVRYHIKSSPMVSIIIPNKDKVDVLKRCINSILHKSSYRNYKIFIVDNQSMEEETLRYYTTLKDKHKIKILSYDKPFNFSAINNYAVSQIDSEYIIFLNNDIEVISPDWIESMLEFAQRRDVGAIGALLYYPNNTIQHAGVIVGVGGVAGHSHKYFPRNTSGYMFRPKVIQNLSAVTGACLMTKKSIFEEVGGFNESYSHAFNDVDFCLKIREKGYLIVYTPYAELYHYESLSRGYEDTPEKQVRFKKEIEYFQRKWEKVLAKGDPYYNPNLTLYREDFSIRI